MKKQDYPLLKKTIYLDSAAGTLKPKCMIKSISEFYKKFPINNHSVDSKLGVKIIKKIEETRQRISKLIECKEKEIIFTSGTTDSLNKIANMLENILKKDDEILISSFNHSSNFVPWVKLAKRKKIKIKISNNLLKDIGEKTKIIAFAQVNNTFLSKDKIEKIYKKANEKKIILINDAAQAISCEKVSLNKSDVIVFSGNKIYGPTGIGVLAVKENLLKKLQPNFWGGGSVIKYNSKEVILKEGYKSFEAGTLNLAGIVGLGESIKYFLKNKNFNKIKQISNYAFSNLKKIENIKILSKKENNIILFKLKNIPSQDVVEYLGNKNIIARSGKHCAIYLFDKLNITDSIRISFGLYNNKKDIDKLIKILKKIKEAKDVL